MEELEFRYDTQLLLDQYVEDGDDADDVADDLLDEIRDYLSSTEVASKVNTDNLYATMAYYARDNCVSAGDQSGCSTDYSVSDIKQVVDIWKANYASGAIEVRLITFDELKDNLGYEYYEEGTSIGYRKTENTPSWVYNSNYRYWTMSSYNDSESDVWVVTNDSYLSLHSVGISGAYFNTVRPVITILKSAI